jgi:hypothetical protein
VLATGDPDVRTFDLGGQSPPHYAIIDYVLLELYTNNFGGTKLKRNYIWGYANKKG